MAEFAHFPESVIKLAREKANELEDFSNASQKEECCKEEVKTTKTSFNINKILFRFLV